MRVEDLMDEGTEVPFVGIDSALELLRDVLRKIASRPGGKSILSRVETYIRCWAMELDDEH
jgi:hypothetical protein